ncbi:MAG: response regulator [Pseudomonadota bacterium]
MKDKKTLYHSFLYALPFITFVFWVIIAVCVIVLSKNAVYHEHSVMMTRVLKSLSTQVAKDIQYGDYYQVKKTFGDFYDGSQMRYFALYLANGNLIVEYPDSGQTSKDGLKFHSNIRDGQGDVIGSIILESDTSSTDRIIFKEIIFFVIFGVCIVIIEMIILLIMAKRYLKPIANFAAELDIINPNNYEEIEGYILNCQQKSYATKELQSFTKAYSRSIQMILAFHRKAEKMKTLAAIGQTTSMLAHDVRKPFSIVKAMMESYDTYINDPVALKEAKQSLDKSIKHVESMLNDIMDFSRDVKLDVRPASVIPVIDFSIRQVSQNHKDTAINFNYNITHTKHPLIDDERIARVFTNILSNAVEAIIQIGKREHGTIDISTHDLNGLDNNTVAIVIGNDGPPLKVEDIPNMFETFFTKGKRKGTGIGLASAHKIIALHGGKIVARNREEGRGVEFIIIVPASDLAETNDISRLPKNIKETQFVEATKDESEIENMISDLVKSMHNIKILLLEDEALYRASVRNTIKQNRSLDQMITLYEAHNVGEALALIKKEKITHAIVDIDLGELKNGFDFLNEVKMGFPNLRCMVHSNRCIEEDKKKAVDLGALAFVPKPLNIEHLVEFLAGKKIENAQTSELIEKSKTDNHSTILLVNDEQPLIIMMKSMLNSAAKLNKDSNMILEFSVAQSYDEAVTLMKNHNFDYIFSDLNLKETKNGMDIIKTAKELKQLSKIYIVSGTQRCDAEPEALELGADGYLQLPVNANDFVGII